MQIVPKEEMLNELVSLEGQGYPIDEALDLLAWQERMGVPTVHVEYECYECSKHTSGLCFECQLEERELEERGV